MIRSIAPLVAFVCLLAPSRAFSADQWIEVKSANFAVVSNASDSQTRKLVWQLEQLRGAMVALWPWAKADLNKPLSVIAVKDEASMRALAPEFWEQRGSVRPASVWVTAPDQHYLIVRADLEVNDQGTNSPFISAYFSYVGLVLDQSLDRDLPWWFKRGFTGVLSNTIVRDDRILIGSPIPWELEILRERPRLRLAELLQVRRDSAMLKQSDSLQSFDAQSWAFVHFLLFAEQSKRAPMLDAFVKLVSSGKDAAAAFAEALGPIEPLEALSFNYIQQQIFSFRQIKIDVSVERARFPIRKLSVAESASARALLHAAMQRPIESRAAVAEARKADANAAEAYAAEGLLLDRERKVEEARTAFAKAAELGTSNAYIYYRLASLTWQPNPSSQVIDQVDALLDKAVTRNTRFAAAYAWLGQLRAIKGNKAAVGLLRRAIALEPQEPSHRIHAAYGLLALGKAPEARVEAQAALTLAEDDQHRREAQSLLERISKTVAAPPR